MSKKYTVQVQDGVIIKVNEPIRIDISPIEVAQMNKGIAMRMPVQDMNGADISDGFYEFAFTPTATNAPVVSNSKKPTLKNAVKKKGFMNPSSSSGESLQQIAEAAKIMTKEAAIAAADGSTASANVLEAAAANEVVAKGNAKGTDPETTQAAVEYANKVANVTKQALQNGPPNIQKLGKKVLAGIKANVRVATDPSDTNIKGAVVANAAT